MGRLAARQGPGRVKITLYVGYPYFTGQNWCAKCAECGKVLSRYAFTEGEARRDAESVSHRCDPASCKVR